METTNFTENQENNDAKQSTTLQEDIEKGSELSKYSTTMAEEDDVSDDTNYNNPTPSATQTSSSASAKRVSKAKINLNRNTMTAIHFITSSIGRSLPFLMALSQFCLPVPSFHDGLSVPYHNLIQVTTQEAQNYYNCTVLAFDSINESMNLTVTGEYNRIQEIRAVNHENVQQAVTVSAHCVNASRDATRALQTWSSSLPLVANETTTSTNTPAVCTGPDQANLTRILARQQDNNDQLPHNQISTVFDSYLQSSRESLIHVTSYARIRAQYDYNYFVGVKIQASLDLLAKATAPNLSLPNTDLLEKLRIILKEILDALNQAYVRVDLLTVSINKFKLSLDELFANYLALYAAAFRLQVNIRAMWPSVLPFPPGLTLELNGFSAPELLKPNIQIPKFNADLPNIDFLFSDYLEQAIALITELLREAADKAEDELRKVLEKLKSQLTLSLSLKDYNPPKYVGSHAGIADPDEEMVYMADMGNATKQQAINALDYKYNTVAGSVNVPPTPPVADLIVSSSPEIKDESTHFSYLDMGLPHLVVPWLLQSFGRFMSHFIYFIDFFMQLCHLYKLKQTYRKNVTPDLPEIEFEADDEDGSDPTESKSKWYTYIGYGPAVIVGAVGPLVFYSCLALIIPFWIVFFKWSPHVSKNCIASKSGTVLSNGLLYPWLVNRAELSGHLYHTTAEFECQKHRQRICNIMFADSDLSQRQDETALNNAFMRFNEANEVAGIFDRCIHLDVLDHIFKEDCCGLFGYTDYNCSASQVNNNCPIDDVALPPTAFRPVGEYLADKGCRDAETWMYEVSDAHFDCETLEESCSANQCHGVNKDFIRSVTIEATCKIESFSLRICQIFFLIVIFRVIIFAFSELVRGAIRQLCWRSLAPNGFNLKTKMNEAGELVKGKSQKERAKYIEEALHRYVLYGWLKLGCAVVVFCGCAAFTFCLKHLYSHFDKVLFVK